MIICIHSALISSISLWIDPSPSLARPSQISSAWASSFFTPLILLLVLMKLIPVLISVSADPLRRWNGRRRTGPWTRRAASGKWVTAGFTSTASRWRTTESTSAEPSTSTAPPHTPSLCLWKVTHSHIYTHTHTATHTGTQCRVWLSALCLQRRPTGWRNPPTCCTLLEKRCVWSVRLKESRRPPSPGASTE